MIPTQRQQRFTYVEEWGQGQSALDSKVNWVGRQTQGMQALLEGIWPTVSEEKGTALFCFWLAKGRRIRSWAFLEHYYVSAVYRWQYLHYLILTLKTPGGRDQPRYINGETEAQRGWVISPGSQEIVNGRSEPRKQTCSLHCTTLCLFAMIWGCRRRQQWKLGDPGGG